jgi:hypothetical protein
MILLLSVRRDACDSDADLKKERDSVVVSLARFAGALSAL